MADARAEAVAAFYDQLAPNYHLIYADWPQAVQRQGRLLSALIRAQLGDGARRILDCSCGIGTQALGLAAQGHCVTATDLSRVALRRAQEHARALGVPLTCHMADMRALAGTVPGRFDVVLSCDNAVPHLLSVSDLRQAAGQMWATLREGGLLVVSIRDYDRIVRERPQATLPRWLDDAAGRRIYVQVWEWVDRVQYVVHLFLVQECQGHWETAHYATRYRCLLREEWNALLRESGFVDIRWQRPEESGYHQPLVTARKAAGRRRGSC